jgi:hypothetical protein
MGITWPSNTVAVIDGIRGAIGRDIEFIVIVSSYECPTCFLDPITNKSEDSFCPTCSGEGYLYDYDEVPVSAVISWGPMNLPDWQGGGMLYDGEVGCQIKNTDANVVLVDTAIAVHVDGHTMEIKKTIPRGVQPLNRLLLTLREQDKDD